MNFRVSRHLLLPATTLAFSLIGGCSTEAGEEEDLQMLRDDVRTTEAELKGTPPRRDPFFAAYPQTGISRISGVDYPIPFKAYDVDVLFVVGTVDYSDVATLARGSGSAPFKTTVDGVDKAIFRIIVLRYDDSDFARPYTEVDFSVDVGPTNADMPPTFGWVNDFSALVPSALPGSKLFLTHSASTSWAPVDGSYRVLGLAENFIVARQARTPSRWKLDIASWWQHDAYRIDGDLRFDRSPAAQLAFANGFAQALGLPDGTALPPPPPVTTVVTLSNDDRVGSGFVNATYYCDVHLTVNKVSPSDDLHLAGLPASFRPILKMRDPNYKYVLGPVLPEYCGKYGIVCRPFPE